MIEKVLEPQEALRVEMEKIAAGGDATLDDFKGKKIKYAIIEGPLGQELETLGFQGRAGDYDPYVNFTFQTKNDISFDDAKNLAQRAEAIIHKHGRQTKTGDENPTDRANPLVDQEYYGTHSITTRIYIRVYVPETDWRKELKRKVTEASAILSIGTELEKITPREHRDNVSRIFRRHYRFAIEGLKAFGINTDGAPDLEEIATKLTPEELNLIIKYLPETALLVIPKVSRQELRETIDRQANKTTNCTVNPIKARSEVEKFDQDALWSNGQVEENNNWRVVFTNGKSSGIYDADRQRSKSSYAQVAILNEYYSSLGIRALSGAKDYMTLLIQELARGYTIDEFGPVTILNASTVTSSTDTPLSAGNWNLRNGNLELSTFSREEHQWRIRLRAALEVNL